MAQTIKTLEEAAGKVDKMKIEMQKQQRTIMAAHKMNHEKATLITSLRNEILEKKSHQRKIHGHDKNH